MYCRHVGMLLYQLQTRFVKFCRNNLKTEMNMCSVFGVVNKMNFVVGRVECEMPLNFSISCMQNLNAVRSERKPPLIQCVTCTWSQTKNSLTKYNFHLLIIKSYNIFIYSAVVTHAHISFIANKISSSIFRIVLATIENPTVHLIFGSKRDQLTVST